ncbi:MAG: flavin reductase family protein [Gammaproteobacteria bacterium]
MDDPAAFMQELEGVEQIKDDFLSAMGKLAATVSIVTTSSAGERSGLTATALCSAKVEPPSMLICVTKTAGTHAMITQSKRYCVNMLQTEQVEVARTFAGMTGHIGEERFTHAGVWSTVDDLPVLTGALSSIRCAVSQALDIGTHTIFVGQVHGILTNPGAEPLLYADKTFSRLVPLGD